MKCELCKKNEATVHFKQVHNGEVKELYVCEICAEKNGFAVQSPLSLTDFLFGVTAQSVGGDQHDEKFCPGCGIKLGEMRKRARLGCPLCYETFSDELELFFEAMQKGTRHVGKVPESYRLNSQILGLEKALDAAVSAQNFEEAAMIRDKIQELRG